MRDPLSRLPFPRRQYKELINRSGGKLSPERIDAILLSDPKAQDARRSASPTRNSGKEVN
jgi:hypothetical protein